MRTEARVIRMTAQADGAAIQVRAAIEDRFHNFRIYARLADGRVERVDVDPIRFPYTLCPAAGARLEGLSGASLSERMSDYFRILDSRHQCTHQFDVAALAIALGARGVTQRRYDIRAVEHAPDIFVCTVLCDGEIALELAVDHDIITVPSQWAGRSLGTGFTSFAAGLDLEVADALLLARRLIYVTIASRHAESYELARHAPAYGGCWVQQPEQNLDALRLRGRILPPDASAANFTAGDDGYLLGSMPSRAEQIS